MLFKYLRSLCVIMMVNWLVEFSMEFKNKIIKDEVVQF